MEPVIFKLDKKKKALAMKKAKEKGFTYSDLLREATDAFLNDEFEMRIVYSPKLMRDVRQAQREIREGKGLRGDLRELLKNK